MIDLDNSYVNIQYNQRTESVEIVWKTAPTSEEFKIGMNQAIDSLEKHQTGSLLSNTTDLGALSEADQQWSYTDWLERALAVGYQRFAVVVSPDIFAQMSVEDTLAHVQGVTIQYFDTVAEGQEWLLAKEPV
ncbi:MAG: STAS/SEC14 domain-containing protein [Tunicatimonas sp.]